MTRREGRHANRIHRWSLFVPLILLLLSPELAARNLLHPDIPTVIAISSDGTMAAVAFAPDNFGRNRLKKIRKGRAPSSFKPVGSLVFYMIGESDNEWTEMLAGKLEGPAATGIITMRFIPGTRSVITKTIDGMIQVRNEAGETVRVIATHDMRSKAPMFSNQSFDVTPDGAAVITPDGGAALQVIRIADGKLVNRIDMGMDRVMSVRVDPTGQFLAASDTSGHIGVWELASGKHLFAYTSKATRMQPYCSLGFSADGKRLGASYGKGTVIVWSTETGEEIYRKRVNAFSMLLDRMNLLFHPVDPDVMAFQYVDPEQTQYEVYDLKRRKTIQHATLALSARNFGFTPDGRYMVIAAWSRHAFAKPEIIRQMGSQVDLHFVRVKWEKFARRH